MLKLVAGESWSNAPGAFASCKHTQCRRSFFTSNLSFLLDVAEVAVQSCAASFEVRLTVVMAFAANSIGNFGVWAIQQERCRLFWQATSFLIGFWLMLAMHSARLNLFECSCSVLRSFFRGALDCGGGLCGSMMTNTTTVTNLKLNLHNLVSTMCFVSQTYTVGFQDILF